MDNENEILQKMEIYIEKLETNLHQYSTQRRNR
jgi:hypothetical protein